MLEVAFQPPGGAASVPVRQTARNGCNGDFCNQRLFFFVLARFASASNKEALLVLTLTGFLEAVSWQQSSKSESLPIREEPVAHL